MVLSILVGAALLLVSLLSYSVAISLIIRVVARLIQADYIGVRFWKNFAGITLVLVITAAVHLTQIALWAVATLLCGAISDFERAFYCSAQNYTALGYGDVLLPERWRLLGPLEAINGLLFFGLSTALLFAIISRLLANRLYAAIDSRKGAVVNHGRASVGGDAPGTGAGDLYSGHRFSVVEEKL